MADEDERPTAGQQAITDLYDIKRGAFLVQYPVGLVLGVTGAGLVAMILTGFLGYPGEDFPSDLFLQPWPLYLWFCFLALLLEMSVLRSSALGNQRLATILWSLPAMALVGIIYYSSSRLVFAISLLGVQAEHAVLTLGQQALTYTVVNVGILLVYWADRSLSWTNWKSGLTSVRALRLWYVIALDLLTGALLSTLLALILQPASLTLLARLLKVNVVVSACMVALPGACTPALSTFDWLIAEVSLALGLLIIIASALPHGITRLRSEARTLKAPELGRIIALVGSDRGRLREALRQPLTRLVLQLRPILLPLLLLVGSVSLASSARAIQAHLHANDALVGKDPGHLLSGITFNAIANALPGFIEGPIGFTSFVAALSVLMFSWRVFENTGQFISLITLIWRFTAWFYFLALFGVNWLGIVSGLTPHHPFDVFSLTALYSFVFLISMFTWLLISRARPARLPEPLDRQPPAPNGA
jgi:hypothetical protein